MMSPDFFPSYTVLSRQSNACRLAIDLCADAPCFEGHFPGFPVLPGVVQLHWVRQLATSLLGTAGSFAGMDQIKFTGIVQPGDALELQLTHDPDAATVAFEFTVAGRKMSSGRLRLALS